MMKRKLALSLWTIFLMFSYESATAGSCFSVPFSNENQVDEVIRTVASHFQCPVQMGERISALCRDIKCRKVLSGVWANGPKYTYACDLNGGYTSYDIPFPLSSDTAKNLVEGLLGKGCAETKEFSEYDPTLISIQTVNCIRFNTLHGNGTKIVSACSKWP